MAFWGVEVRPGQPFTHVSDGAKGRLRVCQATIGIGFVASATKRILVQCNVGNRSPVLLCSLCPGQTDSCPMGVEFEESEDVIFSVIGPRSVHLVGYYICSAHSIGIDESESYGEDIANTDAERSNHFSDEDEYEDSFIDDNDPKVSPPSPISYDEELLEDVKPKKSGHRKLRKKYQKVDSDDDHSDAPALEMEDDDRLPILSVYNGTSERNKNSNGSKQPDKIHEANHNGVSSKSAETPVLDNVPASSKQKKRKRSHVKEAAALEANVHVNHNVVSLEITCQDEGKAENMGKYMQTKHAEEWNPANNGNSIVSTKECENSEGKEEKEKKMVKKREEENLKTEGAMEVEVPVPSTMEVQAPLPSTLCENSMEKEKKKKMEKNREDNLKTEGIMEVEVPVPSTMEVQAPLPSTEFENSEKVKKREENLKTEGTMEVEISVPPTMEVQAPLPSTLCENVKEKVKKKKKIEKKSEDNPKTEGTMEVEVPVPSTMEVRAPLPSTKFENSEKVKKREENLKTEGTMVVEVFVPSTTEVQAPLHLTECENSKEKEKEKKRVEEKLKTEGTMEMEVPVPSTMEAQAPLPSTLRENVKEKVKKKKKMEKKREDNLKTEGTMEVDVSVPSTTEMQAPLHLTECENSKEKEKKKEKKRVGEKLKTEGTMEMEVPVPSAMVVQALLPSTEGNATLKGDTDTAKESPNLKSSQVRTLPNGMIIEELELGKADGKTASQGKKVSVLIFGRLKVDGRIIDSNIDGPFKFRIGRGVIEGLNDGVKGMQAGGRRKVTIPPSLGFGSEGHGDIIPPNSWLVYDIELVKVY